MLTLSTARRALGAAIVTLALTSMALAIDTGPKVPKLSAARANIEAANYAGAIDQLKQIIAADPDNADALNLMGYSLRKSGNRKQALGFYLKALSIDPRHRGANEYLGELYVETGQIEKAKERLQVLEQICGTRCEEYKDLAKAIGG